MPQQDSFQFQAFLSYSNRDKESVRKIAEALETHEVKVWFDEWEIAPGMDFQTALETGIKNSSTWVIFVGEQGLGKWQESEMRVSLIYQTRDRRPVIPVLLPGVPQSVDLPGFLSRFSLIAFNSVPDDQSAMNRLIWGITGVNPARKNRTEGPQSKTLAEPASPDRITVALSNLSGMLIKHNLTFFLGSSAAYGDARFTSRSCDIARALLSEMDLIKAGYDQLLPPLDIASMYYSINTSDESLENRVTSFIAAGSTTIPPTHEWLAKLVRLLAQRPVQRSMYRHQQLIVTTNLDVLMERALLAAGLPFTRLVQHRTANQITINEYSNVSLDNDGAINFPSPEGRAQRVEADHSEALDEFIAEHGKRTVMLEHTRFVGDSNNPLDSLPVQQLTSPILYKLLGSSDVPQSCAISTNQYYELARRAQRRNCIPAQIREIITNSAALLLGHAFLDPDFRITYNLLLSKDERVASTRYALQLPPNQYRDDVYRRMEVRIWEQIKEAGSALYGIRTLEERGDVFLAKLFKEVESSLAGLR